MLFTALLLFFIIINGAFTWELALAGALVCALADVIACKVLGWNREKSKKALRLAPSALLYICLLMKEMIKSGVRLIGIILSPCAREMKSVQTSFDSGLKSDFALTVLSNGISLLPGIYTLGTDGGKLTVCAAGDGFLDAAAVLAEKIRNIEEKEEARA